MDDAGRALGTACAPLPSQAKGMKGRFQYSLLQLLLATLSIGGCMTAWHIGWSSLTLPIILAWLWWFAFARRHWWSRAVLCLAIPSIILCIGSVHVIFSYEQSQWQRALPFDWWITEYQAAEEARRLENLACGKEDYAEGVGVWSVFKFFQFRTWALLVPTLLAGIGFLGTRLRGVRPSRPGWAMVGASLGLLVVMVLGAYPILRAGIRKAALRSHWEMMELTYYEGQLGSDRVSIVLRGGEERASRCEVDRRLPKYAQERLAQCSPEDRPQEEAKLFRSNARIRVYLSPLDLEELWSLLDSEGVFLWNQDLYPFGRIDGWDRNLRISACPQLFQVSSFESTPHDLPMYRFKNRFLAWLRDKGFPEPWDLFHDDYTEEQVVRFWYGGPWTTD